MRVSMSFAPVCQTQIHWEHRGTAHQSSAAVKHLRGQQTPCENFTFLSPGHQRLRHNFGRMGSKPRLQEESLGELSGFTVVMHHFHTNMGTAQTIALSVDILHHYSLLHGQSY